MTIKELERVLGMPRANIRYYEQEGLLTPARGANGYRDYSQADVETLEKIKLLRRLGVELESLRRLQAGELTLSDAVEQQLKRREGERTALDREQAVWEQLADAGVDYGALAARPWLDRLEAPPPPPPEEKPAPQRPWRRYFARSFDLSLYGLALLAVELLVLKLTPRGLDLFWISLLDAYLGYALMFLLEPLMLHHWGTTPGKAIFQIKLRSPDGEKLSVSQARRRLWTLFGQGMGYGLPILSTIRRWSAYLQVRYGGQTGWAYDEQGRTEKLEVSGDRSRCLLYALALAVLFCARTAVTAQGYRPPNMGKLTLEQFTENYNYYADNLESKALPLNKEGQAVTNMDEQAKLTHRTGFTFSDNFDLDQWEMLEGGQGIRFTTQLPLDDTYSYITYYDSVIQQTRVGLYALLGAQEEVDCLHLKSYRWALPLPYQWNYTFTHQGYRVTQRTLYPEGYPTFAGSRELIFDAETPVVLEFTVREMTLWEWSLDQLTGKVSFEEMWERVHKD